jgi:hypothetical protein
MRVSGGFILGSMVVALAMGTSSRAQTPAPAGGLTEVYHVHFTKAAPGKADALGKALMTPDKSAPMPGHALVLRHQEGDSWDYVVIEHLGPKATVDAATPPPSAAIRDLRAWHDDTFVAGPSWADFTREMGLGGSAPASGMVYIVSVQRAVPGHRDQLEKLLMQAPAANSKVKPGNIVMPHLEGGDWNFVSITRYNSWQDLATERAEAAANPGAAGGWNEVRQHSDFHRDTLADRIFPAK